MQQEHSLTSGSCPPLLPFRPLALQGRPTLTPDPVSAQRNVLTSDRIPAVPALPAEFVKGSLRLQCVECIECASVLGGLVEAT
jgi:hypothetical protein